MLPRILSARLIVFPLIASLLVACTSAIPVKPDKLTRENYAYAQSYLTWLIEKEMADNNVTGLSIALVDDQKLVWSSGFGYSDAENKEIATPQTAYRMGSIAKIMTATAAMQMADRGQMDINQPLSRYLPEFSIKSRFPDAGPVTPRNIMSHHSGLPANYLRGMVSTNPAYFTTLVNAVQNEYAAYPPNFVFAYSNLGVTLLGAAIERTSGQNYDQYIKHSVFEPLGMSSSYFSSQPGLKGYSNGKVSEFLPLRDLPSGGLVSTVEDLSRYIKMVFAGGSAGSLQILKPETLAEMLSPQNTQVPLDIDRRLGLGWMLDSADVKGGGVVATHGGSLLNFHSALMVMPEHKLGVVIAANSASAHSVVNKVAVEALKLMLETKAGILQPDKDIVAVPAFSTTDVMSTGYFDTVVGVVKVGSQFGNLNADVMGHSFQISPRNDGWLGVKYNLLGLFPVSVSPLDEIRLAMTRIAGHDVLASISGNEVTLIGEKLQPSLARNALIEYVGKYEVVNQGMGVTPTSLSLLYEDGMFITESTFAQLPNMVFRVAINPISDTEAVLSGLGSGRGDTIRMFKDNAGMHLLFSGLDMRKLN